MRKLTILIALLCLIVPVIAPLNVVAIDRALPRMMPADDPPGGGGDPCEGLPVVTTPISALLPQDCSVNPEYCFADVARIIPLEAGCYVEDVTIRPVEQPTPIAHFAPPIILVGKGPDKTIITGRGTQSAVVKFMKNANGIGGGQIRDVKIKPVYGQDGVYFQMSEIWCLLGGPNTGGECTSARVQNTIINGAKRGVVMDAEGYGGLWGEIVNNTIFGGSSHGLVGLNGASVYTQNNLIISNRGSAFYWEGTPDTHMYGSYNDVWRNGVNNRSLMDYTFDPLMTDWNNFKLSPGSLAINAGQLTIPYIYPYIYYATPTPTPSVTPTPLPTAAVDLGAYGKAEFATPVPAQIVEASRRKPYIDLDWLDAADDVAVRGMVIYKAPTANGPWTFTHSCVLPPVGVGYGDPACAEEYLANDPTPFPTATPGGQPTPGPTPTGLMYLKLVPFDTSYNRGPDSNISSPPTDPVPYQWSVYRDSTHCNSTWNVRMKFNPGSKSGITAGWWPQSGSIDQYEVWHCWRKDGVNCDKVGYVNAPFAGDIFEMHVPCDTKNHYYMFRGRENYGPPPSGGRKSYSPYRTYSTLGSPVRICMVSPDTCTDCPFTSCPASGDTSPCPNGGVCPSTSVYPAPQYAEQESAMCSEFSSDIPGELLMTPNNIVVELDRQAPLRAAMNLSDVPMEEGEAWYEMEVVR